MSEFPKMATVKLPDGRVIPVAWPATHPLKGGQLVIFANKTEEREYDGSGTPQTGPEMPPPQKPVTYPDGKPWWVR